MKSEAYFERKLCKAVEAIRDDQTGMKCKCLKFVSPGCTGVPDRLILIPGGKLLFVEMKKPGEHERARQVYMQACLAVMGFEVLSTIDSLEKIEAVVSRCKELLGGG